MSDQQLEQLEALLATVQKNRQRERGVQLTADGSGAAPALAAGGIPPESPSSSLRRPPVDRRAEPEARRPAAVETPFEPAAAAPARREQPAAPRAQPPAPAQPNPPITPRVIEPDPPRQSARPIAQLVSKHVPAVDATFGAMLKRSLSLRPH